MSEEKRKGDVQLHVPNKKQLIFVRSICRQMSFAKNQDIDSLQNRNIVKI